MKFILWYAVFWGFEALVMSLYMRYDLEGYSKIYERNGSYIIVYILAWILFVVLYNYYIK